MSGAQWNRFDIVEAWYLALADCHGGQSSREYKRLCKIRRYFEPAMGLSVESLNENARTIYDAACERLLS